MIRKATKIDELIKYYPNQLAKEFRNLLQAFRDRNMTRSKVKKLMMEKIAIACNTIHPVRARKKPATEYPFRPDVFEGG